MIIRKKKKSNELGRRRTSNGLPNKNAATYNYTSARSSRETNVGRINVEDQEKILTKVKSHWYRHIPSYIAALVIIVSFLYALTLSSTPKVRIVGLTSQTIVQPANVYQQAAQTIFRSSLSNRTKLTINTDALAAKIEQKYPEINAVSIIIPLIGRQAIVEVRPAESIMILSNPQGQYVINQNGNAVLQLNNLVSTQYNLPVVTDKTGFIVTLGKEALPQTSVKFIKTVVDQFAAKNMVIQSMTLSTTPYEMDVQVRGVPYFIKFSLLADPLYSTGTYFSTIKQFSPSNPAPTQYIDVRIPGRAYYK